MASKSKIFNEVVVMRLLLILFLIIYHSFAPFCGAWDVIPGSKENLIYFWIGKSSYSFFLEAFVFISGLLASSSIAKYKNSSLDISFIKKKFKRLIIPSLVFSIIYFMLYKEWDGILNFLYSIINGVGHMWFLPMLFWCFVILYLLLSFNSRPKFILLIAVILSLCSIQSLPFRIGNTMYYFFFFYFGFIFQSEVLIKLNKKLVNNIIYTYLFIFVFLTTFIISIYTRDTKYGFILFRIFRFFSSLSGLISCYLIIQRVLPVNYSLPPILIILSRYSFGIYIVQQFVLIWLYYHTSLWSLVNYEVLPWIGLIIALTMSILTTHIAYKSRIGRFLLG